MSNPQQRSGFIYAALHPTNTNWVKLGFTRLTPLSRLKSLSSTSVRESFMLHDARFMWDAISSERRAHSWLENEKFVRQKEFFEISKDEIKSLFDILEQHDFLPTIKTKKDGDFKIANSEQDLFDLSPNFYDDYDQHMMENLLNEWSEEDLRGRWKYIQKSGTHDLEVRSAQGDSQASFLLAKNIAKQGVTLDNIRYCTTFTSAAEKQGMANASLQGMQWESLVDESVLPLFWQKMWGWREKKIAGEYIPHLVDEIFEVEQHLLRHSSSRSNSWSSWCMVCSRKPPL